MKTTLSWKIAATFAGAIALASCGGRPAPGESNGAVTAGGTAKTAASKAVVVRVQPVELSSFTNYLRVTGTVKARNQIDVVAEEAGILKEIRVANGATVEAGAPLAVLEGPLLVAARDQAQAALKQAELDQASKKVLYAQKAIAENALLNANYALEAARANLELAQTRVDKLVIRAPIGGIANRRYLDRGAYVVPTTRLFELIDLGRVRIEAGVAERFLSSVRVGTPVDITFDAFPDLALQAPITYVSRGIDPQSRTFDIEVDLDNSDGRITPQMVANLRIRNQSLENRIVIPLDALIETDQGWHVFVAEDGRARKVPVKKLAVSDTAVMVEGLEPGQELVVVGQRSLNDGDSVVPAGL